MVGSTAIAGRLDPEDLTELIHAYRLACAGVVQRFEGYIAQYQGDGILAYFGYPQAHEDNAERAVRAGLEIVDAVNALNISPRWRQEISLAVRIGIATGLVVTSDLLAEGGPEDKMVVGQTLNLAARLQTLAGPNTVVITPRLQRHLGGLFEYEDLGIHDLKGFPQPLRIWQVLRPKIAESRFEAIHEAGLTPLVNREEELDLLMSCWQQAKRSEGRVVLLTGEAGIGKSRTIQGLRERIAREPHLRLYYQCSPYYTNSALYPFINQLERAARFDRQDTPPQKLEKLHQLLSQAPTHNAEMTALFAALWSLPMDYPGLPLNPQRRKEKTLQALLAQITGLASVQPVLVMFEDLQWIDPTSQEALDLLIATVPRLRVLALITSRPGMTPSWLKQAHASQLMLGRLNPQHSLALVKQVAGRATLPANLVEQITAKTDGVPLFVEELTKTLVQLKPFKQHTTSANDSLLEIPSTLKDSLMARLNQLSSAKTIAQIGSVIGREFSHELITALALSPEQQVQEALRQLVDAELVLCQGIPPRATYTFKHALVRDAAYDSLLRHRRQRLHAHLAEILEQRFPEIGTSRPELLAQHYTAAVLPDKAVHYWLQAGQRAYERSANLEAVAHFRKGLEVLDTLIDSHWRREQELALQINLATALITTRGPGSAEVEHTYARALELCSQLPNSPLHFAAYWGWWRISSNFQDFRERADQLLNLAENLQDPGLRLQSHHCQWAVLFNLGDHQTCCEHIDKGLALYQQGDYRSHAALYGGHDPAVCGHGEAALSLWLLGYPERALARLETALELARQVADAGSRAHAMDIALMLHFYRRDADLVQAQAETLGAFAEEQGFPDYLAKRLVFQGWVLAVQGASAEGIVKLTEGIAALRAIGTQEDFPIFFDMLAEAYGLAGRSRQGLTELEAAFSAAEYRGMRHWAAELYRRRGELLLSLRDKPADEAATCFHKALEIARQQQAKALELRAAISLARLLYSQQQGAAAYRFLHPLYTWFGEGLDTPDLCTASQLLRRLAA
jgi:predicted ATPase/class 3 adenylate cyclase